MSRYFRLFAIAILAIVAASELAMGRHVICTCGIVDLWAGGRDSPATSQMIADWYSLSHIVHGLIFYAASLLMAPRRPARQRFLAALIVESLWEVLENSPLVIERYRATTAALGYSGDSVVNSLSDILFMSLGFLVASKLPARLSILLCITLELVPLFVIRDNLTLNILNLLAPNTQVQAWQSGG